MDTTKLILLFILASFGASAQWFENGNPTYFTEGVRAEYFVDANGDTIQIGGGGSLDSLVNGKNPITLDVDGFEGLNANTNDIANWIDSIFYPSQVPTASLTATYDGSTASSFTIERMASGSDLSVTLNWTAGRQEATQDLSTIVAGGVNQAFVNPNAGASTNGTQAVDLVRNSNTTYNLTVTTADGKTASDNVPFVFRDYRYWGFTNQSPTDGEVQGLSKEFITSRTKSETTSNNSSPLYFVIAFPESFDPTNVSQIWVGGLNSTGAFNRTVSDFTNASGATTSYIFYISKSIQNGSITFEIR
jgi:hypothetical protein